MLRREYGYNDYLKEILTHFELGESNFIDVKLFKMLTPDSFLWRLRMTDRTFFLYAEDNVPNLAHVLQRILDETDATNGKFVTVRREYQNKELSGDFLECALVDDFDKVFLFKSTLSGEYDE